MSTETMKRTLSEWLAAQVRVTAFFPSGEFDSKRDFWSELGLGEPDTEERKKGEATTLQGAALDHWLIVRSAHGRVDWLFAPVPPEGFGDDLRFQDLGSFPEAADRF